MDIDFDANYSVNGYGGVAFWIKGYPQKWEAEQFLAIDPESGEEYWELSNEGEWVDDFDSGQIVAVMVGDDREHIVDIEDLTILPEGDFCGGCGQIGCSW
jgi:hypothetical protein